jgi:hygromycin-B 4-O-kinase
MAIPAPVTIEQAHAFLSDYLASPFDDLALIGEGAWSRCFGYRHAGRDYAIRFGNHLDDFEKDQRACRFAGPGLPIPQVFDVGRAFEGYYAVSSRAYGIPLENVDAADWPAVVPSVADVLEAMRTADLSATSGWGGWGADGRAGDASWSAHLLACGHDDPAQRTHGWRARLAAMSPEGDAMFLRGYELLRQVVRDDVPRSLLHCDLINRNVLVERNRVAAVFDWGCARYGDHLYELAWFEFWAPWHPNLDVARLRDELAQRWRAAGYWPALMDARLTACTLHIGLDHLGYNAYTGDMTNLLGTAARMRELVPEL